MLLERSRSAAGTDISPEPNHFAFIAAPAGTQAMGAKPSSQRVKDDGLPQANDAAARAQEGQPTQFAVQPISPAIKAVRI